MVLVVLVGMGVGLDVVLVAKDEDDILNHQQHIRYLHLLLNFRYSIPKQHLQFVLLRQNLLEQRLIVGLLGSCVVERSTR